MAVKIILTVITFLTVELQEFIKKPPVKSLPERVRRAWVWMQIFVAERSDPLKLD